MFGNLVSIGDHASINEATNPPASILCEVPQTLL